MPVGPILGGISGAVNPPAGLNAWQGFTHGLLSGIPAYRFIGSLVHAFQGNLGKFSDPANNPYNHPENFGGSAATTPAVAPAGYAPDPQGPVDPSDPNNPLNQSGGNQAPAAAALQAFLNNNRAAFGTTTQQMNFPGSAIGPFQGVSVPWASTRGAQGLGTPNSVSTEAPAWASIFSSWIRGRNQA